MENDESTAVAAIAYTAAVYAAAVSAAGREAEVVAAAHNVNAVAAAPPAPAAEVEQGAMDGSEGGGEVAGDEGIEAEQQDIPPIPGDGIADGGVTVGQHDAPPISGANQITENISRINTILQQQSVSIAMMQGLAEKVSAIQNHQLGVWRGDQLVGGLHIRARGQSV